MSVFIFITECCPLTRIRSVSATYGTSPYDRKRKAALDEWIAAIPKGQKEIWGDQVRVVGNWREEIMTSFEADMPVTTSTRLSPKSLDVSVENCFKALVTKERERVINN